VRAGDVGSDLRQEAVIDLTFRAKIVSMSEDERLDRILTAAYVCFTRYGVRRTTMDDIAREAGMSRPAVYQYVRNKEDAFRRLTERMLNHALADAREASRAASVAPTERLVRVLEAKLGLALTLWRDSPAHAAELLGADSRLSAELIDAYTVEMRTLLIEATAGILPEDEAPEFADLLLAFTRGLEADPGRGSGDEHCSGCGVGGHGVS